MSIHKVAHKKNFTIIDNRLIEDMDISLESKALLIIMIHLPDDWEYSISGLAHYTNKSPKAISRLLDELERHDYLVMSKCQDDKGQFRYRYEIYEIPHIRIALDDSDKVSF